MLNKFFQLSQNYIINYKQKYVRYFLKNHALTNRFSIISGQRGIGKTTAIIQYIQQHFPDLYTTKALLHTGRPFSVGQSYALCDRRCICEDGRRVALLINLWHKV